MLTFLLGNLTHCLSPYQTERVRLTSELCLLSRVASISLSLCFDVGPLYPRPLTVSAGRRMDGGRELTLPLQITYAILLRL